MASQIEALGAFVEASIEFWLDVEEGGRGQGVELLPPAGGPHRHGGGRREREHLGLVEPRGRRGPGHRGDPPDALYWSVSLGNYWWETIDYANRQSSLNGHQAVLDADGVFRAVVAHARPGRGQLARHRGQPSRGHDLPVAAGRRRAGAGRTCGGLRRAGRSPAAGHGPGRRRRSGAECSMSADRPCSAASRAEEGHGSGPGRCQGGGHRRIEGDGPGHRRTPGRRRGPGGRDGPGPRRPRRDGGRAARAWGATVRWACRWTLPTATRSTPPSPSWASAGVRSTCWSTPSGPVPAGSSSWTTTTGTPRFDLGLMAAVRCVRAGLPLLRTAEWARIVNVSAHSTQRQSPLHRGLHRGQGRPDQRVQEPVQVVGSRGDPGQHGEPRVDRHRQLQRGSAGRLRAKRGSTPPIPTTS